MFTCGEIQHSFLEDCVGGGGEENSRKSIVECLTNNWGKNSKCNCILSYVTFQKKTCKSSKKPTFKCLKEDGLHIFGSTRRGLGLPHRHLEGTWLVHYCCWEKLCRLFKMMVHERSEKRLEGGGGVRRMLLRK